MKNTLLLLFACLIFNSTFAQVQITDYGRNYTDTLPSAFKLNIADVRSSVFDRIPENLKSTERKKRSAFRFSDQSAIQVSSLLKTGMVYSDWQAFQNYLNQIFDKVVPEGLPDRENVKMYILKDGGFNAFMTPTGVSCVNIGVFADIDDEATLAGILAHELAHYILQHSLKRFIKAERGEFRQGIFRKNKASSQFSIANETQADSMAMIWMEQSGYSMQGMYRAFSIMKERQDKMLGLFEDRWEFKATTHPLPDSRLEHLHSFESKDKGTDFLVSEKLFREFKEKAKPEILKHLLDNFSYNACIETAFKFHIEDTNKAVYLYYLMEAIRRSCYLNPDNWSKNFITHRYYEVVEDTKENRKKKKWDAHLFEKSPKELLGFTKEEVLKMQGGFYWDGEVKFMTNEQAFDFFFRVSELFNEPECILSNALSITRADDIRAKELEKYLAFENVRYRDYAKALLGNSIHKSLKDKKMVVWSGFQTIVRQGKEDIPLRVEDPTAINPLSLMFDTVMTKFPDRTPVFLPDWQNYRLNDYMILSQLEQFSFSRTVSKGQRTELHILDPRFWDAFKRLGVNEIQFLNCIYYESRNAEKTMEGYQELIAKDYMEIFNEKKRTKYLELFVSSVRAVENAAMKVRYYGGDNKLKFKKQARQQIIKIIQARLSEMEMETKEMDRFYRKN